MKAFVIIISIIGLGLAIFLTWMFVKNNTLIAIPFVWIILLAGWAAAISARNKQ